MARIDVVDEGIIDADCSTVFKAYTDEFGGINHLWTPLWESKPRGDDVTVQKGTVAGITTKWKRTAKFAMKVTEFVKDRLFVEELFEGDFIGTGEWTFEPLDGRTKVIVAHVLRPKPHIIIMSALDMMDSCRTMSLAS